MDDDGSPGRVASIDQGTTPKVGKVASEGTSVPSKAGASSSSDWRAGNEGIRLCEIYTGCSSRKLEKALEVMSDVDGPAVEALRAELKEVQNAASVPTLDVQIQQCKTFIMRSERWLAEIDAQRVAEQESLIADQSQGQVGAVAVRGGPVCRPSRIRITGGSG